LIADYEVGMGENAAAGLSGDPYLRLLAGLGGRSERSRACDEDLDRAALY